MGVVRADGDQRRRQWSEPASRLLGRRLPHDSALAMVAVVVASLALAPVVGLLALRRLGAAPRAARSARLRV